ncbi:MAG: hypothetical protein JXB30_04645 [Anaerolineae bacterium]|nr:hypothetical protein [Anaerolineae bacterium]
MTLHAESIQFNRSRYSDLLALIDSVSPLTRRETKLVWLALLCFDFPDLSPLSEHSLAAKRGLQRLVAQTDLDYVTHGNPTLSKDLLDRIKAAKCQELFVE